MKNARDNDSAIHFMGLLSDGGVHSHNTHLYGLLEMAKREGLKKVYVHCFLDGRDTRRHPERAILKHCRRRWRKSAWVRSA